MSRGGSSKLARRDLHRPLVLASAVLACSALLVSCVSPAVDRAGYRDKVNHSAQKMVGIIGSAQLAAELSLQGKMFSTLTDAVISDAEQDAQSVVTSLDSVQPPDAASIELRDAADQVLQNASSQLSDLRIAERRDDKAAMRSALADLGKTLTATQKLQDST